MCSVILVAIFPVAVSIVIFHLFVGLCCQESGPLCERAMVMNVLDHSFDVMIIKLGVIKRVYCNVSRHQHLCSID